MPDTAPSATTVTPGIGLALSGGGFRAALFHLGVIRFLYEAKRLEQVVRICSVSGGSVLAAHLVLEWPSFTGEEPEFDKAVKKFLELIRRDVRGNVVRRTLLSSIAVIPRLFSRSSLRTRLLTAQYQTLYGGAKLSELDLKLATKARPHLSILATSMVTGRLCAFDSTGLTYLGETGEHSTDPAETYRVAKAVAASSAFPPLFPPLSVTRKDLGSLRRDARHDESLTDGGVYDNVGVAMMNHLQETRGVLSTVVVSDAGAPFDWTPEPTYRWIMPRTWRTTDILMNRVARLERPHETVAEHPVTIVGVSIDDERVDPTPPALSTIAQRRVRSVRTDLDRFT